jgi:hypothetical protein
VDIYKIKKDMKRLRRFNESKTDIDYDYIYQCFAELLDDEKIILGVLCKKAKLTFISGEVAEYWYAPTFPLTIPQNNFFNSKIPGIPLEFSTVANGFYMHFKCANFSDQIENVDRYFAPIVSKEFTVIDFKSYLKYLELEKQKELEKMKEKK